MRIFCYKVTARRIVSILAAAFLLTICLRAFSSAADEAQLKPNPPKVGDADQQMHITSDSMISNNKTNYAEFIGNVKVTQGTTVIVANRLKIFFENKLDNQDNLGMNEESIKKIVANGNVTINFDNKVAVSEQAVYITQTKILVLTGANSKITSGKDSVSGEKITIYRDDGRINVESNDKEKVEAVF